jgi:predicted dehydrogenase
VRRLYRDYEQMLASGELEAVCISASHDMHYEMARAALQAGLHVFCEKPLGMNSRQTGELAALAQQSGLKTMVAFTNRWVPEAQLARRLAEEGYWGQTFHYNVCQLASYGRPGGGWMWRADPRQGGGVLYDLGCHNIDLAQWLAGPLAAVCATLLNTSPTRLRDGRPVPTPTNDSVAFVGRFASGGQGIFHISWTSTGDRLMRHEIAGSEGLLSLSLYHDVWMNQISGCPVGQPALSPLPVPDDLQGVIPREVGTEADRAVAHEAFLLQYPSLVRAFLDCVRDDTEPSPSFAAGHATQQVMDAVLLSEREQRWVTVGEAW